MIKDVEKLIRGGLKHSGEVELASLIWTIDANEHCIVKPEEINVALEHIVNFEIVRSNGTISILTSETRSNDKISQTDIAKAMEYYESMIRNTK